MWNTLIRERHAIKQSLMAFVKLPLFLNDQFQSVFTDTNFTPTVPREGNTFSHIPPTNITTEGVLQLLQELDLHKASGPDGIPSKFLKETSVSIAPSLTLIYQASLHQGELPSDWKMAYMTPVY